MITTLFNKVNIILKLQIYIDLVTCSHSDCSLVRSLELAGISRELGFFQVSSYLSCREIQIGKKRKEKKEKIKRRRRRKKEKKRGKEEERKRGKRKKIFFHLFLPSFMQSEWIIEAEGSEAWKVATILLACFSVLRVTVTRRFQFNF